MCVVDAEFGGAGAPTVDASVGQRGRQERWRFWRRWWWQWRRREQHASGWTPEPAKVTPVKVPSEARGRGSRTQEGTTSRRLDIFYPSLHSN